MNEKFTAKDKILAAYLVEAIWSSQHFNKFELTQIPRDENEHTNALPKLASSEDVDMFKIVLAELLLKPIVGQKVKI